MSLCVKLRRNARVTLMMFLLLTVLIVLNYNTEYSKNAKGMHKLNEVLAAKHNDILKTINWNPSNKFDLVDSDDCDDVCQAEIQKSRKILIHDVCYKTDTTAPDISNQSFINHLNHLYVIDKYKLLYCFVPKVACTNIKRTLLTGLDFLQPNQEIPHIDIHVMADSVLPLLSNFKPKDIMYRLNEYQKVLFVREPISRLVSAYRDKLEKPTNQDSINFRKKFSAKIKKLKDSVDDLTNGIEYNATFEDFASYLGDPSTVLDYTEDHWRPISDLCMPCQIKYDFIGKFETLTRDNDFVIKKFLLPNSADLHLHPPTNPTNSSHRSTIDKYTSNLSKQKMRALFERFQMDFKLFSYNIDI